MKKLINFLHEREREREREHYLIGKPFVVPGRTPAMPCCVIGLSSILTLNCLAVGSPLLVRVRLRAEPTLVSPEAAVGARLDIIDADGGLARAKRPGVAVRNVAELTYSAALSL